MCLPDGVCDTIHHYHLELRSAFLECRPLELGQHRRYAAGVMKVSSDEACIPMLDHLQSMDVILGVRVPHCTGILQDRAHEGQIAQCLRLPWAGSDVSLQEGTDSTGFLSYCFVVICPVQVVLKLDTKVFCCVCCDELLTMDVV